MNTSDAPGPIAVADFDEWTTLRQVQMGSRIAIDDGLLAQLVCFLEGSARAAHQYDQEHPAPINRIFAGRMEDMASELRADSKESEVLRQTLDYGIADEDYRRLWVILHRQPWRGSDTEPA